jgi:hypothetical protein
VRGQPQTPHRSGERHLKNLAPLFSFASRKLSRTTILVSSFLKWCVRNVQDSGPR